MDPVTASALIGGGASIIGGLLSSNDQPDYEAIAKANLEAQKVENARQRKFSRELLAMSRTNISAEELGNLLFAQGEAQYNKQSDRNLATVLAKNLRTGSPSSANDIMARFNNEAGSERADRMMSSRLKGITGTLPGAAAIQSAAALYSNEAPQMQPYQASINNGDRLAAFGYALPGLVKNATSLFGGTGNNNTGDFTATQNRR